MHKHYQWNEPKNKYRTQVLVLILEETEEEDEIYDMEDEMD